MRPRPRARHMPTAGSSTAPCSDSPSRTGWSHPWSCSRTRASESAYRGRILGVRRHRRPQPREHRGNRTACGAHRQGLVARQPDSGANGSRPAAGGRVPDPGGARSPCGLARRQGGSADADRRGDVPHRADPRPGMLARSVSRAAAFREQRGRAARPDHYRSRWRDGCHRDQRRRGPDAELSQQLRAAPGVRRVGGDRGVRPARQRRTDRRGGSRAAHRRRVPRRNHDRHPRRHPDGAPGP